MHRSANTNQEVCSVGHNCEDSGLCGRDRSEVWFQEFQGWQCLGKPSVACSVRNMELRGMSAALIWQARRVLNPADMETPFKNLRDECWK